jgi:CAAX protease family protein
MATTSHPASTPAGAPSGAVAHARHGELTTSSVWRFFAATFLVSWGLGALVVTFMDQVESWFGPMGYTNPAFILMVYSPGFIGIFMVWHHYGLTGLKAFFRRLTLGRMSTGWWLLLLLGMPAVFYGGAVITGNVGNFPFDPWYGVLPALLPAFLIGPIEEFGWRGVALPLLQRHYAPLWAGLILGVVSATWHAPAFLMSGTKQSAWNFWPYFFGVIAIGVILTAMFNAASGSLLVAFLFHAQMNGPAWPDAQPWDMVGFVLVALVVVWANRATMLRRGSGSTDVLLASEPSSYPERLGTNADLAPAEPAPAGQALADEVGDRS